MKKYSLVIAIIILIKITSCCSITYAESVKHKPSLTIIQAIKLGYPSAKEWNNQATLLNGINIDLENNQFSGINGRRNNWNIMFGVPDTNKIFLVTIHDGKISDKNDLTSENESPYPKEEFMNLSDIKYDSPQLLKRAKAQAQIYPGKNWAKGYSFRILMDTEKRIPVIFVIGWDKVQKHMKSILFNANTGRHIQIND